MKKTVLNLVLALWLVPLWSSGQLGAQEVALISQKASAALDLGSPPQKYPASLTDVLKFLQEEYQVFFTYSSELVRNRSVASIPSKHENLDVLLDQLLKPLGLTHHNVEGKFYVITRLHEAPAETGGYATNKTTLSLAEAPINRRRIPILNQLNVSTFSNIQPILFPVTGIVTDENGEPLIGVNVVVKGSSIGTITDIDGRFSIELDDGQEVLQFSYVGYVTLEVPVEGRSELNVSLATNATALDEVVVVGFGTKQRKDVTEAIASVSGEELNEIPVPSFEQALSGRAAGVQVVSGSGVPGAGATIRVRGVGSLNNSEPLYVIDGIIIGNAAGGGQSSISPLSLINPNDIESIDILKDASATAIYGARAGNGVVIITTKRGREGKMNLNFDAFTGWNVLDRSSFDMMNGPQWAQYFSEIMNESGMAEYPGKPFIDKVLAGNAQPTYDWFDYAYRNGRTNSFNLSLNAGSSKSRYFASANYFDQTGILPNSDLTRGTARFNSDHQISRRLKFGNTLAVSRSEANTIGNVDGETNTKDWITRLLSMNPYKPIFDPVDGDYAGLSAQDPDAEAQLDYANQHTIWVLEQRYDNQVRNRIWGSLYADYEIINGLTFHTMGSVDWSLNNRETRTPANTIDGAATVDETSTRLNLNQFEGRTWFIENTLTYARTLGAHDFSIMAGHQGQNTLNKGFGSGAGGFVDTDYWFFDRPQLTSDIVDSEGNVVATIPLVQPSVDNFQNESAIVSFFGRLTYNFDDRYLLTATIRHDGSSRFGPDRRWGTFPAVSAGWNLSREAFMENVEQITNLKLRAGYGISGSDNTSLYQWNSRIGSGDNQNYVLNGGRVPGAILTRIANPLLGWEEISMLNLGVDIGFFNQRLEVTIDYFDKITEGMLLPFAPALEVGTLSNPSGNLGKLQNRGIELTISSMNIATSNFSWRSDLNFSAISNEILALPEDADRFNGLDFGPTVNISRVGEEIGALFGFQTNGLFQNWNEVYSHAYQNQSVTGFDEATGLPIYSENTDQATINNNTAPGDLRYVDQNGDGFIDADNDRVVIGSTIPDFTWGFNNTFRYKGINLSIFFQGVHGVEVFNQLRVRQERSAGGWANKRTTLLDRWTGEGTSSNIPRSAILDPNANERPSDHWVEDASFIRLRNVRLSYNIPGQLLRNIGWQSGGINIYAIGTNLLTFTQYSGFDPEIGLRDAGNPETAGVDAGLYPLTRQFTIGAEITF